MKPEEFRRHAHEMVDWMADYLAAVGDLPVKSQVKPGDIEAQLPAGPPQQGEDMTAIFDDFRRVILPGITHWQHPSFFAYFPANSSPPSVLAEMLTATLGVNGMMWQTSPAATELETRVMQWLRGMIGLPADFTGVIQDTASTATLTALLTARERATQWATNGSGLHDAGIFTVYSSEETHSSIEKDMRIIGLGGDNLRRIAVDGDNAMRPDALEAAIAADRAAGRKPLAVVATLGSTANGAFDPLPSIAAICRREGLWLHVDAAWAGSAFILPEHRTLMRGAEHADSFLFNPHKWLLTNFDCTAYFVRDLQALVRTFDIMRVYFQTAERGAAIDYRDWGIQLGRRFRALKLWFVIRSYGVAGLQRLIGSHIAAAQDFVRRIEAAEDFELMAPAPLALVVFRYHPPGVDVPADLDRLNALLAQRVNDDGRLYLTPGKARGAATLRLSVGQTATTQQHVERAWDVIRDTARSL
jgi:aromatic-L-amino-acid decarboxylase